MRNCTRLEVPCAGVTAWVNLLCGPSALRQQILDINDLEKVRGKSEHVPCV